MGWKQVKVFNVKEAGTKVYWCLRNVRLGYRIGPKRPYAINDWRKNQQHREAPPKGVAVPVYFDCWLTLDDKYDNYGHIAVSLPNGKVWTDGKVYGSVEDVASQYLASSKGRYLGWGESVNSIRVVKFVEEPKKHRYAHLIGKTIKLMPKNGSWRAYKEGTNQVVGDLMRVPGADGLYIVRGVSVCPNRVLVNSKALGKGISVPLANAAAGKEYTGEWKVI